MRNESSLTSLEATEEDNHPLERLLSFSDCRQYASYKRTKHLWESKCVPQLISFPTHMG